MQKLSTSRIISRGVLLLLVSIGTVSFFLFSTLPFLNWAFLFFALIVALMIILGTGEFYTLLFLVFSFSFLLYGLYYTNNLPFYLIMLGIIVFFGLIFFFSARDLIKDRENFWLFFLFHLIVITQSFLALSFWLVNPLSRSLVLSLIEYIFVGFLLAKKSDEFDIKLFKVYIYIAALLLIVMLFTVSWGQ